MAYAGSADQRRWPGALAALLVQGLLAMFVILGLAGRHSSNLQEREPTLVAFDQPSPQPEPEPKPSPAASRPEPAGGPAAAKAKPAAREAPPPKVVIAQPSPAATRAGSGTAADAGSAALGGTGTGTGVAGTGPGGGGSGAGAVTAPVRIAGGLGDRDYPRSAAARGAAGTVAISFRVRRDGRVDDCSVLRSSGDRELDSLTCALVERRFVYRPARGPEGDPRETTLRTTFTWGVRPR
jgi:protein TonB